MAQVKPSLNQHAASVAIAAILDGKVKAGPLEIAKIILEHLPAELEDLDAKQIAAEIAVMIAEDFADVG